MKRLRGGPLLQNVLEQFQVTANESDIRPKFLMYSGHDTSISRLTILCVYFSEKYCFQLTCGIKKINFKTIGYYFTLNKIV
jgi:hypothetical protein